MENGDLADRLAALERRVDELAAGPAAVPAPSMEETFWALHGLRQRVKEEGGAVLFTGAVTLPTGEAFDWQFGLLTDDLLADDWAGFAGPLTALANPVRLALLRAVLGGVRTAADLQEQAGLGTSGQLYHHLRQLTGAGWLRVTTRGHYAVPGEKVVPLLTILAAVRT